MKTPFSSDPQRRLTYQDAAWNNLMVDDDCSYGRLTIFSGENDIVTR